MSVYDIEKGRLGNAIFRYLASSVYALVYNLERHSQGNYIIDDTYFFKWKVRICVKYVIHLYFRAGKYKVCLTALQLEKYTNGFLLPV